MTRTLLLLLAAALFLPPRAEAKTPPPDSAKVVAYVGGRVWDGERFAERPLLVRGGRFVENAEADTTVGLGGGYVVPPFGDAHTHSLGVGGVSTVIADSLFLRHGIFYAADLTNPYSEIREIEDAFEQPTTLDVAYANGGLTSTGSHPTAAMERVYADADEVTLENLTLEGDAYWFMDSVSTVEERWPAYIAQDSDIVKVYLTYVSEGLEEGACYGLCPDVLHEIVERAHAVGKRVFAHVNTAADVRLALGAGVDALAHLPLGNDGISIEEAEPFCLSGETIRRLGEKEMIVVPTALLLAKDLETFRTDTLRQEIALQRKQVRTLHEAGARIALSGHDWGATALREAMYFRAYDFFDNRTLLNLWSRTTPQAIFPDRKIGRLEEGYEASFLVLGGSPLEDFGAVQDIRLRVKEGHVLSRLR